MMKTTINDNGNPNELKIFPNNKIIKDVIRGISYGLKYKGKVHCHPITLNTDYSIETTITLFTDNTFFKLITKT